MCAYPVPALKEPLLRSFLTYQRTHCAPKQTNGTLLWHFTELDYVSAFLLLWHCESLESRSWVWFLHSSPLRGLGWGRGRDGAVERSGVTAFPALRVQSNSACV